MPETLWGHIMCRKQYVPDLLWGSSLMIFIGFKLGLHMALTRVNWSLVFGVNFQV